jgi:hypothetical protein
MTVKFAGFINAFGGTVKLTDAMSNPFCVMMREDTV